MARIIQRFYDIGIFRDWWKLEPIENEAAWATTCTAITDNDYWCCGILVLGLDASKDHLRASFGSAAKHDLVKGFAVGRTIFSNAAQKWVVGDMSDAQAIADMAEKYRALCNIWDTSQKRTNT